ncbi:MAG: trypsin-like peptidase domain-containing protein [bacterium]|nr:trypsin-like peptidase domain-containing protein [bacterium]
MKRYLTVLALMVIAASAAVVFVAEFQEGGPIPAARRRPPPVAPAGPELSIEEVVERINPAVVAIDTTARRAVLPPSGDPLLRLFMRGRAVVTEVEGIGAGVIFDADGYVLTNAHVVGGAHEILVTLADGRQLEGRICAVDRERDIALVRLPERGLPVAPIGDSEGLDVGQWVLAFGNPFGTASRGATASVSMGVVSALQRNLRVAGRPYGGLIQTDAAINTGNNGGPLVDMSGRVVGLNTLVVAPAGASAGFGFAIPINTVREVLDRLLRECDRPAGPAGAR